MCTASSAIRTEFATIQIAHALMPNEISLGPMAAVLGSSGGRARAARANTSAAATAVEFVAGKLRLAGSVPDGLAVLNPLLG